jgi:hypothetical protein
MGIPGLVQLGVSPRIRTGCMTWEETSGNGVRIGTTRKIHTAFCAVDRGTPTTRSSFCSLLGITSRPITVVLSSDFGVFWR